MQRVVLEPLKDDYKVVVQRVTSLEKFHACPYAFKFGWGYTPKTKEKHIENERGLFFGNKFHEYLQSYALNAWTKDELNKNQYQIIEQALKKTYEEKEFLHAMKMISAWVTMYDYLHTHDIYNVISTEVKLYVEVEVWDILFILTGSADALSLNKDWTYSVLDWKTSRNEYGLEDVEGKIQKYTYPWIIAKTLWRENLRDFSYLVTTKHMTPRCQRIPIHINDSGKKTSTEYDRLIRWVNAWHEIEVKSSDVETFMWDLISNYADAVRYDVWKAKNKVIIDETSIDNKQCIRCSLKDNCPAFNTFISQADWIF